MFSLLHIWNQWATECHTLQILHNSCICYPAKMLSWCFKALSPLLQKKKKKVHITDTTNAKTFFTQHLKSSKQRIEIEKTCKVEQSTSKFFAA